jgi:DNA polymerase sigma
VKGLNQPYLGGLSSYSLVLMVEAFFNTYSMKTISQALLGFLDFYGNNFDPKQYEILHG